MKWLDRFKTAEWRAHSILLTIIAAAVIIELISVVQYWYAYQDTHKAVQRRAESELQMKELEIQKILASVESAIDNSVWMVERNLSQPDSTYTISRHLVEQNPAIVGAAALFVADYYPQYGRWCELYVTQRADGTFEQWQMGGLSHDYLNRTWFREAMAAGKGYWSEPYYDESGAKMMLCTYFAPIRDAKGQVVGLLGADLSLDWLSEVTNANHIFPSSYNILVSRTGQLIVCPVESLVLKSSVNALTDQTRDTADDHVGRQMLAGKEGNASFVNEQGEKSYIFYAPIEGSTGWSMAVVCQDREIYYTLRRVSFNFSLLMLAGMILMGYIIWRAIRSIRRLNETSNQKAAIEGELRVASDIQMSLLPKIFPPYPDRKDVDVHASLVSAKEVGGDLYDFYIRDEKLFFCIGDVSGKGVPASLFMAITRTLFRNVSAHEARPNKILTTINGTLAGDNPNNIFVTFFIGVLDLPTGLLRYSNAGHEAPVLLGAGDLSRLPCDSNLPLGALEEWEYTLQETVIKPQTTIFLFTDGLTEAMNASLEEFGKKRMMETLKGQEVADPKSILDEMAAAVHRFVGDAEQSDDLTMLAVRYTKEQQTALLDRSITLPNDVGTVPQLNDFVNEVCQELQVDSKTRNRICLAVEEAVVNVMNYAYPMGQEGTVEIEAAANDERLKFTITDSGIPFDPTARPEVDINAPVEERPIGGLGIHLIRQYMDSMNYNRMDGKNILTLRKKLIK